MEFQRTLSNKILAYLDIFPCVGIVGPRQVGKTTLVKLLSKQFKKESIYLDLESDEDLVKLSNAEQYFQERQDKLIIIDEVQRKPELFILLRSVIDKKRENSRFILLGSASPELLAHSSETLAGRIGFIEMHPLTYEEVKGAIQINTLWLRGGFPNALLQPSDEASHWVRQQLIQTYLEREFALLGLSTSPLQLKNLIRMLAHLQGQTLNYSQLSGSLGVNTATVKKYLDFFENAFIIRRLEPFYANVKKRLVKSPKVYIRDSGLFHSVLQITDQETLDGFYAKGSSWESFVIQQIIARLNADTEAYFYRTQDGTELDLVLVKGLRVAAGIEIKLTNAPHPTRGTTLAYKDLGSPPIWILTHSAGEDYALNDHIQVTSFERIFYHLDKLKLIS